MGFIKYVVIDFSQAMKIKEKISRCERIHFYYDITGHKNIKMFYLTGHDIKDTKEIAYLCLQEEDGKIRYMTKKKVNHPKYITLPIPGAHYITGPTAFTDQERQELKDKLKANGLCHPGMEVGKVNGEYKPL